MSPVTKSVIPGTWTRRLSSTVDYTYNSDGNSSSYSSAEDNQRLERQYIPSFMMNDDLNGRSYVDPWDMENYSFLRKQLEGINLSDNELSPAFESTQSDFYYVPLDNNGSPQYQYKHYVDLGTYKGGASPQSYRDDVHGLMANIDEYDFYNEHLDTAHPILRNDDSHHEFNNPSRQSERSRFNNQDYHTYTPPSIIKDIPDVYIPNPVCKLRRRASVSFSPDIHVNHVVENDSFPSYQSHRTMENDKWQGRRKSTADVRIKLNRRKSFHDALNKPDFTFSKLERRRSVLDHPNLERWRNFQTEVIPERQFKEKLDKRPEVIEYSKKPQKGEKEGILYNSGNRGPRNGYSVSFNGETKFEKVLPKVTLNSQPNSSLVYVYETARRRRKMFLPNMSPKIFESDDFRYGRSEIPDAFALDPIEQYLNRPSSRYTMTNYGHLKIDYSCSWNYLDKCMAQRLCL